MNFINKPAIGKLAAWSLLFVGAPGLPQPDPSPPPFVDVTGDSNIAYQVGYTLPSLRGYFAWALHRATNGGAAAGDCDKDGDIDLFITYGNTGGPDGGGGANRLYLNQLVEQGNGFRFEDIAEEAGVANTRLDGKGNDRHSGPTFADMDGDGDLDLFLGGIYDDPSRIYENNGDCHFTDVTSNSPDIESMVASNTISAAFGDYDLDGDLDMFLTHWGTLDELYGYPRELETDHLWRNESDQSGIRFVNVSEETGISDLTWLTRPEPFCGERVCPNGGDVQIADFTFTPTFARISDDLWPDIAIAADFGTTQLAINFGGERFGVLDNPILRDAQYGMGSALGDIDNDGDLDWFVTSVFGPGNQNITPRGNRLYLNDGGSSVFVDDTARLGVADGSFGWGACFVDIDNDSDLDIYHTNGYPEPYLTPDDAYNVDASRAFLMNETGTYADAADAMGLAVRTSGRGVVCADFDNDGDSDILELTDAAPNSARLWENRTAAAGRNFLRVRLEGLPPNTEAAGARIFARIGDTTQMREIMIGSNYTTQNPSVQVFGLESAEFVDEIVVEWPPIDSDAGPVQLGTLVNGPIAASQPGRTIVIRHPELP
jgi:hypothetical protein